jgi:dipeptidyl aminopeptidase/acylaminoacyl peptidase
VVPPTRSCDRCPWSRSSFPSWSPDGTKIVFVSTRGDDIGEIYVMDANGSNTIRLTTNTVLDYHPSRQPASGVAPTTTTPATTAG